MTKTMPKFLPWLLTGALTLGATLAHAADTIKVGVLHSLSGTMAISETTLKDTVLMLVDEQNPLADEPEWLEYVPPATPATMDAELGIQVPYSEYAVDPENPAFPPPPREALPLDAPLED